MTPEQILAGMGAPETDPKRIAVLDAAFDAFLDFGIRRTSMGEIARRAGISPATLYRWFGSKEELLRAVGRRNLWQFIQSIETTIDREASALEQLTQITVAFTQRVRNQPLLDRTFDTEPELVLPQFTRQAGPVLQLATLYMAAHLMRLVDEGKLAPLVPHGPMPVAEVMVRVAWSMFLTPTTLFAPDDDEAARRILGDLMRRMVEIPLDA